MDPISVPDVSCSSCGQLQVQCTQEKESAMARWRRSVWESIAVLVFALVFSIGAGYLEKVYAQNSTAEIPSIQTQIAVHDVQIKTLAESQSKLESEMHDIHIEVASINDTLSTMRGIGTGAICLLTMLNLAGLGMHMYNRKP